MIWMLLGLGYLFRYPSWLACLGLTVVLRLVAITVDLSMFALLHSWGALDSIWARFLSILPANLFWGACFAGLGALLVLIRKLVLRHQERRHLEEHRAAMARVNSAS